MSTGVKAAFRPKVVMLKTKMLVPTKPLDSKERTHPKYLQIATSLTAVGLIEPLVVFPADRRTYRVLDGHKRLDILKERKVEEVECLISTDDETYTYNHRVNYLSPVGEHQMILRALKHNSEEAIAAALNVNVSTIRKKRNLLDGLCPEAVDVLKDRRVSPDAFAILRKMKPVRQIEAAELMVASNLYTLRFAEALLAGTRGEMLISPEKAAATKALSSDQKARITSETENLFQNSKIVEESYSTEALTLSVCCRYLQKVMGNANLSRHIAKFHPDISSELQELTASFNTESGRSGRSSKLRVQAAGR